VTADRDSLLESVPGPVTPELEQTLALLTRAREGDGAAANELFARYEERIRRIVRVRLGPGLRRWTESGDLVQETCRSALESLERLELESDFDLLDWLARIATNRIRDLVDHVHAARRDVDRVQSLEPAAPGQLVGAALPPDPRSSPSEHAFRGEVRSLLDEVVATLPEDYREVVLLRDYQGAGWPWIAQALGSTSVHAAQQLHQRAWIKVRALAAPRLAGLRGE